MPAEDSETSLRSILLVTKYTRLEQYVDERSRAELCVLDDFEEALRQPERWTRDFTIDLLAQRDITDIEVIPDYYIRKFHEHYEGLAHMLNAFDEHSERIGRVWTLPFKMYLKLHAPSGDMVRRAILKRYSHVIIAAGDETFKTMVPNFIKQPCLGVRTAESSEGWFSSCAAQEFSERLEDIIKGNYTIDRYHTVEVSHNGRPLMTQTLSEVSLWPRKEKLNSNVRLALNEGSSRIEHDKSSGIIVSPLAGVEAWLENVVHRFDTFQRDYVSAVNLSRAKDKPMVAWAVREPQDRENRQYGFTDRLEVEVLCPSLVVIGDEDEFLVEAGDILTFTPSEIPINIIRFRDNDY